MNKMESIDTIYVKGFVVNEDMIEYVNGLVTPTDNPDIDRVALYMIAYNQGVTSTESEGLAVKAVTQVTRSRR